MTTLRIWSCHHVLPDAALHTGLYRTLVTGHRPGPALRASTDLDGTNIAGHHRFSELRHQYHVWQDRLGETDLVGFEHYRRPILVDPLPEGAVAARYPALLPLRRLAASNPEAAEIIADDAAFAAFEAMRAAYTPEEEARVTAFAREHDALCLLPILEPVTAHFAQYHGHAAEWEAFARLVDLRLDLRLPGAIPVADMAWSCYLNSFVMRTELFATYAAALFDVLFEIDARFPEAPPRLWGHMAERMLGAFLLRESVRRPGFRFRTMPFLISHARKR